MECVGVNSYGISAGAPMMIQSIDLIEDFDQVPLRLPYGRDLAAHRSPGSMAGSLTGQV
jgi:hypothetical protein